MSRRRPECIVCDGKHDPAKHARALEDRDRLTEALEQEAEMYPCENPYDPLTGWK